MEKAMKWFETEIKPIVKEVAEKFDSLKSFKEFDKWFTDKFPNQEEREKIAILTVAYMHDDKN